MIGNQQSLRQMQHGACSANAGLLPEEPRSVCTDRKVPCLLGCGMKVDEAALSLHMATQCTKRSLLCPLGCGAELDADMINAHKADSCPKRIVLCPLGCGQEGEARMLDLHAAKYCPNRPGVSGKAAATAAVTPVPAAAASLAVFSPPVATLASAAPAALQQPKSGAPLPVPTAGEQPQPAALRVAQSKVPPPSASPKLASVTSPAATPSAAAAAAAAGAAAGALDSQASSAATSVHQAAAAIPGLSIMSMAPVASVGQSSMHGAMLACAMGKTTMTGAGATPSILPAGSSPPGSQLPQQLQHPQQMNLPLVAKAAGTSQQLPQQMSPQPLQQMQQLQQPLNLVGSSSQPAKPTMASVPGQQPTSPHMALLLIRQGVAAQDREMVKKAVAAAEKASVPIEPHVRAMLQQWLGELSTAASPSTVPAPASVGCPTGTMPAASVGSTAALISAPVGQASAQPQHPPLQPAASNSPSLSSSNAPSAKIAPEVAAPRALQPNSGVTAKAAAPPTAVLGGAAEPAAPTVIVKRPVLHKAAAEEPAPAEEPDLDASFEALLREVGDVDEDASSGAAPVNVGKEDDSTAPPPEAEKAAPATDKVPADNGQQQPAAKRPKTAVADEVARPASSEKQPSGGGSAAIKEAVDTRTAAAVAPATAVVPTFAAAAAVVKAKEPDAWGHREIEEDRKSAQAPREAWEYLKKDEFGTGNFFDFNKF
mmetsp:Transcript_51100/g.98855  ORF Transcript_51100/g.98855 Transcript_51100/m.98855 type:complete len:711 (-) Transcript_51100:52-2184(-)